MSSNGNKDEDKEVTSYQRMQTESKIESKGEKELSKQLHEEGQELGVGNDTYAMAFKALHWDAASELGLSTFDVYNAYHAAIFVAGIQWSMLAFMTFMMYTYSTFEIVLPRDVATMAARFICTILMHL